MSRVIYLEFCKEIKTMYFSKDCTFSESVSIENCAENICKIVINANLKK